MGLKFSNENELKNHQQKFCNNSHYNDLAKLDQRLASLKQPDQNNIKVPMDDIRDYIQGKGQDLGRQSVPNGGVNDLDFNSNPYSLN